VAESPEDRWERLNRAFEHYQTFIKKKPKGEFPLAIEDLLHVSNFKGGNASITEGESELDDKLKPYSACLKNIYDEFPNASLSRLDSAGEKKLIEHCKKLVALPEQEDSKIEGLGPSYASALGAAHFPELIPVLDRRAVNGAGIPNVRWYENGQPKDLESHYESLIKHCKKRIGKGRNQRLRDLDKKLFSKATPLKEDIARAKEKYQTATPTSKEIKAAKKAAK
jgi:hypothetical protein